MDLRFFLNSLPITLFYTYYYLQKSIIFYYNITPLQFRDIFSYDANNFYSLPNKKTATGKTTVINEKDWIFMKLTASLDENMKALEEVFPIGISFDIMVKPLRLGETRACLVGINGLCRSEVLYSVLSNLQDPLFTKDSRVTDLERYLAAKIGFIQSEATSDPEAVIRHILSGPSVLFVDGFDKAIVIDARSYPHRGIDEPDTERVVKGAKDGFIEVLLSNTALIRRRIRNPKLVFRMYTVGSSSRTDVAVCYLQGIAADDIIREIDNKLNALNITTLTMGSKSLEELIVKKRFLNPLPSIFLTERPDVACSYIAEGHVAVIVDNSPSVIILPCTVFHFTQAPEDYYKGISTGNYIRLIRFACILISLLAMPVYLLSCDFTLRLFFYVLITDLCLDFFKHSSAHAAGSFSGSLALIGGLILGEAAIELNWTSTEAIFYAAATMLATLSLSSIELGEAIRLYRLFLIILTGLFDIWGFAAGCLLILISAATTPTFAGRGYFWPLIPFNLKALGRLLFRCPTSAAQPIVSNRREKKLRKAPPNT